MWWQETAVLYCTEFIVHLFLCLYIHTYVHMFPPSKCQCEMHSKALNKIEQERHWAADGRVWKCVEERKARTGEKKLNKIILTSAQGKIKTKQKKFKRTKIFQCDKLQQQKTQK